MGNKKNCAALLGLSLLLAFAGAAYAHEGGKHFKGTVKSVEADSLTIVTPTNETVTLKLSSTTKFLKSKEPSSVQDLKAGDRVVIHAKQNGTAWEAEEVDFGAAPVKAPAAQ